MEKPFSVSRRVVNDVAILELGGLAVYVTPAMHFRQAIDLAIRDGYRKIILDYAHVVYSHDSTFLGALVTSYTALKNMQGEVVLIQMTSDMNDLFATTKLNTIFRSFKTLPEALEYFGIPQSEAASAGVKE